MQRRTPHEIWVYGIFETLLNLPQCGNGGEGVRHIRQLSLANSYGYKRLGAHSDLSTQPSTHVIVTAQIH